jgi:transcriptional regulator with XRE-family HTH domain
MVETWRERMKQRRKELQLSREALAERLGLTPSTVGHWETGTREPETLERFEALAQALELHPMELIYGIPYDAEFLPLLLRLKELPPDARTAIKAIISAFSAPES